MDKQTRRLRLLNWKRDGAELNKILNEWDFLHVVPFGVENEYLDLIDPILNAIYNNASQKELATIVCGTISRLYGLDVPIKRCTGLAEKIFLWQKRREV